MTVHRDSLFNALLNNSELKAENEFLLKKTKNQKLIIQSQGIVINQVEIKTEILTKQIKTQRRRKIKSGIKLLLIGIAVGLGIGASL